MRISPSTRLKEVLNADLELNTLRQRMKQKIGFKQIKQAKVNITCQPKFRLKSPPAFNLSAGATQSTNFKSLKAIV